jgi:hypothetical protein
MHGSRWLDGSVALVGLAGAEHEVADGVERLQAVALLDEGLELERQPLAGGRLVGEAAHRRRRALHVHLALFAGEGRHLRRLDDEVAALARHPSHPLQPPRAVPALQVHHRACTSTNTHGAYTYAMYRSM